MVPLTDSAPSPVTVSVGPSPSTALPLIVNAFVLPTTVPKVEMVLPVSRVVAPKVTASLKVCVPVVVMLPPLIAVVPAASVVMLLSLSPAVPLPTAPPTAPPKLVLPLSLIAKLRLPPLDLTELASVMFTPVSVVSRPKVTASLKVCAPVVRTLPPLMAVVPTASVVRLVSRSPSVPSAPEPPTDPPKVVATLSLMVKLRLVPLDLIVSVSVMLAPVSVVFAPRVTGPV